MITEVLGPGCTNCETWEPVTKNILAEPRIETRIEKTKKFEMVEGFVEYPTLVDYGRYWVPRVV